MEVILGLLWALEGSCGVETDICGLRRRLGPAGETRNDSKVVRPVEKLLMRPVMEMNLHVGDQRTFTGELRFDHTGILPLARVTELPHAPDWCALEPC